MDEIIFDNRKYLTTRRTAYILGCTSDYVAKLCREGALESRRDGKDWFVSENSITEFRKKSEKERKEKAEELAKKRRQAYRKAQGLTSWDDFKKEVKKRKYAPALVSVMLFFVSVLGFQHFGHAKIHEVFTSGSGHFISIADYVSDLAPEVAMGAEIVSQDAEEIFSSIKESAFQSGEEVSYVVKNYTDRFLISYNKVLTLYPSAIKKTGEVGYGHVNKINGSLAASVSQFVKTSEAVSQLPEKVSGIFGSVGNEKENFQDANLALINKSISSKQYAGIFGSIVDITKNAAVGVYCSFSGLFGNGGCESQNERNFVINNIQGESTPVFVDSEKQIEIEDGSQVVTEKGSDQIVQNKYVTENVQNVVRVESISAEEIESRFKLFEERLKLSGDRKIAVKRGGGSSISVDNIYEDINDSVADAVSSGSSNFDGESLTVSGDVLGANAEFSGTVTAASFVGNGNFTTSSTSDATILNLVNTGSAIFNGTPGTPHDFISWSIGDPDAHADSSPLYINPGSANADTNLFGIAVGGSARFLVDAEGDVFANSLTTVGSTALSSTTISTLNVENAAILGDSVTDQIIANGRFSSDILPYVDNMYDLGTTTSRFRTLSLGGSATIGDDLFVAGNVGIGTSTPISTLSVVGNQYLSGKLEIGTTTSVSSALALTGISRLAGNVIINPINMTTGPFFPLEVHTVTNGAAINMRARGGNNVGFQFSLADNTVGANGYNKSGLFFVADGTGFGRGDLYLVNNNSADGSNASTTDVRLTIKSSGNVGIGTTTPGSKLDVWGNLSVGTSSTPALFVNTANTRVGVGTNSPQQSLDVNGAIRSNGTFYTSSGSNIFAFDAPQSGYVYLKPIITDDSNQDIVIRPYDGNVIFGNRNGNSSNVAITSSGNVGIGTVSPSDKLSVVGSDPNSIASFTNSAAYSSGGGGAIKLYANDGSTDVTSGSRIGLILFGGRRNGSNQNAATMEAYATENWGASNSGNAIAFQTVANGGTTRSEKLRITGDGRVGIGTTAPDRSLHISQADSQIMLSRASNNNYATIEFRSGSNADWDIGTRYGTDGFYIRRSSDGYNALFANKASGNIGIGTTTPSQKLTIANGNIELDTSSLTAGAIYQSGFSIFHTYGTQNVFLGKNAGNFTTSGTGGNVAIGEEALSGITTGFKNIGIGYQAGKLISTPQGNVAIGYVALSADIDPSNTFALGVQAFQNGTGFVSSIGIGTNVGRNISGATNSVFIGESSAGGSGDSSYSVAIGQGSLFGPAAKVVAIGQGALNNTSFNASHVIAIGRRAGSNITTASGSIIIGSEVDAPSATTAGQLNIGNLIYGTGLASNPLSPTSVPIASANVGIGTTTPGQKLVVNGNAQFTSVGSGAYGFDLNITSDGTLTTSASDERLKTNLEQLDSAVTLDKVLRLTPYSFTWRTDVTNKKDLGLIAQQVEDILPELVFENPTDGYKGINYSRIPALLIASIQELNTKIDKIADSLSDKIVSIKELFVGKIHIQNEVCVDEVCVTKDEFKQILLDARTSASVPGQNSSDSDRSDTSNENSGTNDPENTTTESGVSATSTDSAESAAETESVTETPAAEEVASDPAPSEEPVVEEVEPESVPEPAVSEESAAPEESSDPAPAQ